jgi:uncharacterized membrane protein
VKKRNYSSKNPPAGKRMDPHSADTISDCEFYIVGALLICLALGLRLYHLGVRQVWLDEAFSHYIAILPNWVSSILADNNPPLYYLLLRAWTAIAGSGETLLRLPSALFGVMFVAITIWAGREIFTRAAGLWSGAVAAFSPIHIYYSQEARAYALQNALLILALVLLWRAAANNSWRRWVLFSAAFSVLLFSHYLTPLALLPTVVLPLLMADKARLLRFIIAATASFLLFLPWLIWSFVLSSRPGVGTAWIENVWDQTPKIFAIPISLEIFGLGSQAGLIPMWMHQFDVINFPPALRILGLAVLLVLGIVVAMPQGDTALGIARIGLRKAWFAALLFCPLLMLWLISWAKPLYAMGRYDFLAYPAFPILVGLAFAKLHRNLGWPVAALLAVLLLAPVSAKLYFYYQAPETAKPRMTAQFLDSEVKNKDVVVFTGLRALPVLFYLNRAGNIWENSLCNNSLTGRSFSCRMYPRVAEQTPASEPGQMPDSPGQVRAELTGYLAGFHDRTGTFWVVLSGVQPLPKADQLLLEELLRSGFVQVRDPAAEKLLIIKLKKP